MVAAYSQDIADMRVEQDAGPEVVQNVPQSTVHGGCLRLRLMASSYSL